MVGINLPSASGLSPWIEMAAKNLPTLAEVTGSAPEPPTKATIPAIDTNHQKAKRSFFWSFSTDFRRLSIAHRHCLAVFFSYFRVACNFSADSTIPVLRFGGLHSIQRAAIIDSSPDRVVCHAHGRARSAPAGRRRSSRRPLQCNRGRSQATPPSLGCLRGRFPTPDCGPPPPSLVAVRSRSTPCSVLATLCGPMCTHQASVPMLQALDLALVTGF